MGPGQGSPAACHTSRYLNAAEMFSSRARPARLVKACHRGRRCQTCACEKRGCVRLARCRASDVQDGASARRTQFTWSCRRIRPWFATPHRQPRTRRRSTTLRCSRISPLCPDNACESLLDDEDTLFFFHGERSGCGMTPFRGCLVPIFLGGFGYLYVPSGDHPTGIPRYAGQQPGFILSTSSWQGTRAVETRAMADALGKMISTLSPSQIEALSNVLALAQGGDQRRSVEAVEVPTNVDSGDTVTRFALRLASTWCPCRKGSGPCLVLTPRFHAHLCADVHPPVHELCAPDDHPRAGTLLRRPLASPERPRDGDALVFHHVYRHPAVDVRRVHHQL